MKRDKIKKCAGCGKGIAHDQNLIFYTVTIQRFGLDVRAIQRQTGLEMMLGSPALAAVMGADEDLAVAVDEVPLTMTVCMDCSMSAPLAELQEKAFARAAPEPEDEDP